MRSAIALAAFAATALAAPYQKRDEVIETDIDLVLVTDVVTIYATGPAPSDAPANTQYNHAPWGQGHSWGGAPSWVEATSTTPPPAPVETSTSVYVPPAPTSTSVYVAPSPAWTPSTEDSTTAAPAATWAAPASNVDVATGTSGEGNLISWTSSAAYTGYSDVVVLHHNFHRYNHSSPSLVWNETLAESAQALANTCSYGHNTDINGGGYGQNIAAGVDMNNVTTVITDLFYNGEVPWFDGLYGQAQPDMTNFEHWGHFSQIVWADTVSVACATSNCTAGGLANVGDDTPPYFTVCNYFPSGNWAGEYGANIGSPKGLSSINWNAS